MQSYACGWSAPPDMLTYLAMRHDTHVKRVYMGSAYRLGTLYFVERLVGRSHGGFPELEGLPTTSGQ